MPFITPTSRAGRSNSLNTVTSSCSNASWGVGTVTCSGSRKTTSWTVSWNTIRRKACVTARAVSCVCHSMKRPKPYSQGKKRTVTDFFPKHCRQSYNSDIKLLLHLLGVNRMVTVLNRYTHENEQHPICEPCLQPSGKAHLYRQPLQESERPRALWLR